MVHTFVALNRLIFKRIQHMYPGSIMQSTRLFIITPSLIPAISDRLPSLFSHFGKTFLTDLALR